MTDNNIELSRRKILGSLGAVGVAGAAAGYGTSALYTDEEEFEGNTIAAGELDLKMDWEEHYSFPQIYDDFSDPTVEDGVELDVVRVDPDDPDYVGLPDPNPGSEREPVVWANDNDNPLGLDVSDPPSSLELYFQNTIIEAFPDESSTDPQGTFTEVTEEGEPRVINACERLADSPEDLSTYNEEIAGGTLQDPGRTLNGDTYDFETEEEKPLLYLDDVKPGDFGEFTFSTHICDNPGYLWLQMPGGLDESENGFTEPEEDVDDTPGESELAQNIETTLWYDDNCNNRIDGEPEPLVFIAVLDTSESQETVLNRLAAGGNQLAERLAADAEVPVYGGVITLDDTGDGRDAVLQNLDGLPPITDIDNYVDSSGNGKFTPGGEILPGPGEVGGNSPLPHALDVAREYLNDQVANDPNGVGIPSNARKEILFLSDGAPSYGTGGGGSAGGPGRGALIDPSENIVSDSTGSDIVSDYFDTTANNTLVRYPNPSTTDGGTSRAETVLVARDIDGNVFASGTTYEQGPGPKVDNPDNQGDPSDPYGEDDADISGDNDVLVRGIVSYDPSELSSTQQTRAEDTLLAIATDGNFYNLAQNSPTSVGNAIFMDQNVTGFSEEVIFRGTLDELAQQLDPGQGGPVPLDHDRLTAEQDCFPAGATHCFGLAWWVPEDVGNVIQSDSVGFDLGFYSEQCRNNDEPTGPTT